MLGRNPQARLALLIGVVWGPGVNFSQGLRGVLIVVTWAMSYETLTVGYTWDSMLGGYTLSVLSTRILVV